MPFLGTIINFSAVLIAGLLGSLVRRGVPERLSQAIINAMGICVIYIGVTGMIQDIPAVAPDAFLSAGLTKTLIMILSMAIGTLIGTLADIDRLMNRFGAFAQRKLGARHHDGEGTIAKGLVSCSLLFCVGAMAVNGAIQDALGHPDILLAKSVIDGIVCFVMASTLGAGCALSAFTLLGYQGAVALAGFFLSPLLPEASLSFLSATGSLVIVLIGTNMLGITHVKTANMVPAMFIALALAPLFGAL